jgi:uncharacterized damage-inducible protein DinB
MKADEIRFLYRYDRWATERVLAALDGLDPAAWERPNAIDERGLGAILVHQLGAAMRWRIAFQSQGEQEGPEIENDPLPSIEELRRLWREEWAAIETWMSNMTDEFPGYAFDGVPVWQMLVHVVNHGTQHRAEAAALLSMEGRSPGELDLVHYAYEQAQGG